MKNLVFAFLLIAFSGYSQYIINPYQFASGNFIEGFENTKGITTDLNSPISSYSDLLSRMPGKKYTSNPVITHDASYTNICPGGWLVDPLDNTKFLLYVGEFLGNTRSGARIALYTGNLSDPYTLTRYGVVLTAGSSGAFDDDGVAFGSALYVSGTTVNLYFGAKKVSTSVESAGLAVSTDGGRTFGAHQQAMSPLGTNADRGITDPCVIKDGSTYYMYSTRKEGAVASTALPTGGIIISTSSDGLTFTRNGNVAVSLGSNTAADGLYIEGGQVIKIGPDYILLYTASSKTNLWNICAASSSLPSTAFTKSTVNPVFEHANSGNDSQGVAVPLLVNPSGNTWVIYYQGTTQQQPSTVWDLFAASFDSRENSPAGFLNGKNGWSGDVGIFDVSSIVTISESRTLRALTNLANVSITHPINVTASASAYCKMTIRCSVASGAFRGGFYIMEGSNIITGVYFNSGNLSYLKNTGWTTLQAYSANTNYTVEVFLPTKTTHTIKVNGSTIVSNQTNFTAITTFADKLKLEKDNASSDVVYFDDIACIN